MPPTTSRRGHKNGIQISSQVDIDIRLDHSPSQVAFLTSFLMLSRASTVWTLNTCLTSDAIVFNSASFTPLPTPIARTMTSVAFSLIAVVVVCDGSVEAPSVKTTTK